MPPPFHRHHQLGLAVVLALICLVPAALSAAPPPQKAYLTAPGVGMAFAERNTARRDGTGRAEVGPPHGAPGVSADTELVLEATADTMISEAEPDKSFGDLVGAPEQEGLLVGADDQANRPNGIYRGLLRFDTSGIPATAYVLNARLSLYSVMTYDFVPSHPTRSIEAYPVSETWAEATVTWNSRPAAGTAEAASIAIASCSDQSCFQSYAGPLDTGLVQGWVSGDTANHGLLLRDEESEKAFVLRGLGTREGGARYVAKLIVDYAFGPMTPTPTIPAKQTAGAPTATPRPVRLPYLSRAHVLHTSVPTPTRTPTWTPTPRPTLVPMAEVKVDNATGGGLCYQIDGTGIGRKCYSTGVHDYGRFATGTYRYSVSSDRCGGTSGTKYYGSGEYVHRFWCGVAPARLMAR